MSETKLIFGDCLEKMKERINSGLKVDAIITDLPYGTIVACVNTNRNFIGIEIDEKYFDIAKNRLEGTTIQKKLGIKKLF